MRRKISLGRCLLAASALLVTLPSMAASDPPQLFVSYCDPDTDPRITPPLDGINCFYIIFQGAAIPKTGADYEALVKRVREVRASPNATLLSWILLPKGNGDLLTPSPPPPSSGSLYVTYMFIPANGGVRFDSTILKNVAAPDTVGAFFRIEEMVKRLTNSRPTTILNWVYYPK